MIFLRVLPIAVFVTTVLCVTAGGWQYPFFFAYSAVLWLSSSAIYTFAPKDLVRERMKPPSDRDRATQRIAFPVMLVHYVVAGLDVGRFQWTQVSVWLQAAGLASVTLGMGLVGWTLLTNPFASSAVRIQDERKQTVVSTGPYALVRHPMYLGVAFFTLGSGLALGSWISWAMALPLLGVFVRRTLKEDRMLHDELDGYAEYAKKVRWRVIPFVF